MSLKHENGGLAEAGYAEKHAGAVPTYDSPTHGDIEVGENRLHQDLKGRHMQMIAMQVHHSKSSSVY